MVKYWRSKAVNIVLYLDDGLGISLDYDSCLKDSFFIRKSLTEAGFLLMLIDQFLHLLNQLSGLV